MNIQARTHNPNPPNPDHPFVGLIESQMIGMLVIPLTAGPNSPTAMARLPRIDVPGVPEHVIARGVDRQPCFFDNSDYIAYLEYLRAAAAKADVAIHAFVLMTNHIHLLATGALPRSISVMMQAIGRRYVRRVNQTYRRTGTLFEGRFRATLVQSERYLLTCMRYIELNPVRAGMASNPADYRWSSFRCNAGLESGGWLQPHPEYLRLGAGTNVHTAYRDLFRTLIDAEDIRAIRLHINKDCVLGSERFQTEIAAMPGRRAYVASVGRPRKEPSMLA
jgi:putative transposase